MRKSAIMGQITIPDLVLAQMLINTAEDFIITHSKLVMLLTTACMETVFKWKAADFFIKVWTDKVHDLTLS